MSDNRSEEEFQAHISFVETAPNEGDPFPEPDTSPPAPYGSLGPPIFAAALAGRSYRAIVARQNPLTDDAPAAGVYFLTADYDVAMADLDHSINVASASATLRVADLIRIGSIVIEGRVRGVYQIRCTNTGGLGAGTPSDEAGSIVTITMKRVDPNLHAP